MSRNHRFVLQQSNTTTGEHDANRPMIPSLQVQANGITAVSGAPARTLLGFRVTAANVPLSIAIPFQHMVEEPSSALGLFPVMALNGRLLMPPQPVVSVLHAREIAVIRVIETATNETVTQMDVDRHSESARDKILRGVLRQTDRDRFHVHETWADVQDRFDLARDGA